MGRYGGFEAEGPGQEVQHHPPATVSFIYRTPVNFIEQEFL